LCFVVPARQDFDAIITAVQGVPQIQEVQVFDIYAGKNLGEDKKSISIKIKITGS
jgi:phenylalanyl-tRNA synthetase beta subunit